MTIYRLQYDSSSYPSVRIESEEYRHEHSTCKKPFAPNKKKSSVWTILKGKYEYDLYNEYGPVKAAHPDLSNLLGSIVLSEKAKDKIGKVLEKYGELLPISIEENQHYYFNLLNSTNAIDPFNSKKNIFEGVEMGIQKISFVEREVKVLFIFHTSYDGYSYIYCTNEFKSLIENSSLISGWSFHEDLRDTEMFGDDVAES